jgi:MFS family permease
MATGYPLYAFLIAFLFGSYLAISETVQRAMIPEFTKPEFKGTAYACYYTLIGTGSLAANSIFGSLWSNVSPTAAFRYSIVISLVALAALIMFSAWRRKFRH